MQTKMSHYLYLILALSKKCAGEKAQPKATLPWAPVTQLLTVFIKCFLKTNLADQAASPATIKQATAVAGNIRKAFTPPGHYTISI